MVKTIQSVCAESRRQVNVALPFSPAIRAGDFVFVSGQVGFGEDMRIVAGGIEAEIRQALENIANILALDGSVLEDVIKCTVWLDDARDFPALNKNFAECFPGGRPARSTVESRPMIDAKIEIDAIAYGPIAS
jgi:reactive intermediate/imine deaminase